MAEPSDVPLLADWNAQLIADEGHRHQLNPEQLRKRMSGWLSSIYRAAIFSESDAAVAYALFTDNQKEIHLRHFFVVRDHRRRGIGRQAIQLLRDEVWPSDRRRVVDALAGNRQAIDFWRAVGFIDYSITFEMLPEREEPGE